MRRTRDEAGMSLAETLVVMMLMGLLGTLVMTFVTTVQRQMSTSQVTNQNTNEASAATNQVTKLLRGAVPLKVKNQPTDSPAFVEATPTAVTFYTVVDTDPMTTPPMLVRLEVTAEGNLVEKRWLVDPESADPYWTFPSTADTPSSTRTIAHGLTAKPGSGKALFTFLAYDDDGDTVTVGGASPLTKEQRTTVGAVRLDAETQTGPRTKPTVVTTVIGLRNLPAGSHG
ncbi:MAG: type II secretion system GspH family protein [Micrococcales bacterium]|nr:type II secretion system GspH family protein [Micrococcales bacterium]MCL2666469.1 type II secretion system GspH family protein [Micrococcales bacterium]